MNPRWRTGHKLGRTLYQGDTLIGLIDTREDATRIVQAVNEYEALHEVADVGRAITGDPEGTISPENIDALNDALARLDAAGTENA